MAQKDLSILRHSAAHLAAQAIMELYPGTLLTIGPATEEGFFYDVLPSRNLKEDDLRAIEDRMHELSKKNYPIAHKEISKAEARELYKGNPFKNELIDEIPDDLVGLSVQGDFKDLCRGGHVPSTGDIQHFKLLGISGSYWRADKSKQPLQRIHGTAFFTAEDLSAFEKLQEDLLQYDHRRLGKQLDYFSLHEDAAGFPFFHPKGQQIIMTLQSYMRQLHKEYDYKEIATPTLLNADLWRRSGHYDHYKENMYFTEIDGTQYAIKPMNCPGAFLIFGHRPRSYRELPLKLAEFGHVHRFELSGVLHGLLRVRAFTIDDTHIFCTLEQVEQEILKILELAFRVLKKCEFEAISLAISTRPTKSMGTDLEWNKATTALEEALKKFGHPYVIQEGEGAFYGPKIEIVIKDTMGRAWQTGTIQVDFFQSQNFDLNYVSSEGTQVRPVIIHQAIYGSFERFFAILLEHYKGHLPLWLAPVQVRILTITDAQDAYAQKLYERLKKEGIRVEVDLSSDKITSKVKSAQMAKIPWMLVVGNKEVEAGTVSIRYADGKQELGVSLDTLLKKAHELNAL
jgi:threonyl-tRNA synthetase